MASRPHGSRSLGPYSSSKETWVAYCERLEQYFAANDIVDERAVLLSECGSETYQLIRNLVAPEKPKNKTFDALVKLVTNHLTPPPSLVQRFHFNTRTQHEGETVEAFLAELRRLLEHSDYGDTLDDMLRDRLIRDVQVRRQLLAETKLKAFEIAQGAELADKHSKAVHKQISSTPSGVNRLANSVPKDFPTVPCTRCGGRHSPKTCRFEDYICGKCELKGYLAKICRSSETQPQPKKRQETYKPRKQVLPTHQVQEESRKILSNSRDPLITVNVKINSVPLSI